MCCWIGADWWVARLVPALSGTPGSLDGRQKHTLHVLVRRGCPCLALLPASEGECALSRRKLTLAREEAPDGVCSLEQL